MKQQLLLKTCSKSTRLNRYVYVLYMVLAFYLAVKGNFVWAFTNLGIALVFGPFNTMEKWQHKPLYQKAWLLVHMAIVLAGMLFLYFQKH